ncbi:hypothetical protein TraAM80_03852 [Trypanosoma rangeli]|uniref:Uncharacterized protein n=1 Tax=Trypanosoma rangeli TaxID=5698 RepID=A0A3R7KF13_TRYRA|nr:uncharacterized protein TraAM80_03852 [Trypanosoma rangeli]RNF06583.1 hypothetical protein TraAM80_03852 [Trypanosoma rangeli]|eukprot:RNF06583.1 hypothetical protein TraAM80_03852 [Trypanosoma rangeli]
MLKVDWRPGEAGAEGTQQPGATLHEGGAHRLSTVNGNGESCVTVFELPPSPVHEMSPSSATTSARGNIKTVPGTSAGTRVFSSLVSFSSAVNGNEDNTVATLRTQLRCAELSNSILRDNNDTLKAVANQLAAQLDLANNGLALYQEQEQVQALRRSGHEGQNKGNACREASATEAEYEHCIASLYRAVRGKNATLTYFRNEMEVRKVDASVLLQASLERKDNYILQLMGELDQLRRVQGIGCYAQIRSK